MMHLKRLALAACGAALTAACSLVADVGQFDNATAARSDGALSSLDGEADDGSVTPEPDGAGEDASTADVQVAADSAADGDTAVFDVDAGDATARWTDSGDATAPATDSGEAGAPATDAGDGATVESDAADSAAPPSDAGKDAAALAWCAAHASPNTLDCHDFDEENAAAAGFTSNYYTSIFAAVTSADYAPGSPPSALLISTPLLDAGGGSANEQFNDIVAHQGKLDLTFSLKIVNFDPTSGDVSLFRISYKDNDWALTFDCQNTMAALNESATLADGETYNHAHLASQPPFTAWTTVDVLVDFVDRTLAMTYNGISVVTGQTIQSPTETNPPLFVQLGLNFLGSPAKPMMIYYDDIVLSTPP
jgi:hypothetical protein